MISAARTLPGMKRLTTRPARARTHPRPRRTYPVYLKEHREALDPVPTLEEIGARFNPPVEKAQVSKWESMGAKGFISTGTVAAYAEAIGKTPIEMYYPPRRKSTDAMLDQLSDIDRAQIIGYIEGFLRRKPN